MELLVKAISAITIFTGSSSFLKTHRLRYSVDDERGICPLKRVFLAETDLQFPLLAQLEAPVHRGVISTGHIWSEEHHWECLASKTPLFDCVILSREVAKNLRKIREAGLPETLRCAQGDTSCVRP